MVPRTQVRSSVRLSAPSAGGCMADLLVGETVNYWSVLVTLHAVRADGAARGSLTHEGVGDEGVVLDTIIHLSSSLSSLSFITHGFCLFLPPLEHHLPLLCQPEL